MLQLTQLTGMSVNRGVPVTSLSNIAATNTGLATVTIPATAHAGDLAVLVEAVMHSSTPADAVPNGFSKIISFTGGNGRVTASYKVLSAGDPSSSISGIADGSVSDDRAILIFRPNVPINYVTPSPWLTEHTAGDPAAQVASAAGGAAPLVVVGMAFAPGGGVAFSTLSPAVDGSTGGGRISVVYKTYNSSPANHTFDMNDLGANNFLMSGYISVF